MSIVSKDVLCSAATAMSSAVKFLMSWTYRSVCIGSWVNLMVGMSFTACRERYSSDGCPLCWLRESWKLVLFDKLIGEEGIVSNSTQPNYSWLYNILQLPENYCNGCWIFSRCRTCTCMYSLCTFLTFLNNSYFSKNQHNRIFEWKTLNLQNNLIVSLMKALLIQLKPWMKAHFHHYANLSMWEEGYSNHPVFVLPLYLIDYKILLSRWAIIGQNGIWKFRFSKIFFKKHIIEMWKF